MTESELRWTSAGRTDLGKVRKVNEDALLEHGVIGLWAVADGMGGHTAGDVASALVVDELRGLGPAASLGDAVEAIEDRLRAANQRLRELGEQRHHQTIGCTVAILLAYAHFALCIWAGDSRIYRHRAGRLERLTQDHALVEDLVEQGMLSRRQAEQHPQANLITRAVGAADALYLDMDVFAVDSGDVFLLCSDGLTKELSETRIAGVLAHGSVSEMARTLVQSALDEGARDNTTVVIVRAQDADIPDREDTVFPTGPDEAVPTI